MCDDAIVDPAKKSHKKAHSVNRKLSSIQKTSSILRNGIHDTIDHPKPLLVGLHTRPPSAALSLAPDNTSLPPLPRNTGGRATTTAIRQHGAQLPGQDDARRYRLPPMARRQMGHSLLPSGEGPPSKTDPAFAVQADISLVSRRLISPLFVRSLFSGVVECMLTSLRYRHDRTRCVCEAERGVRQKRGETDWIGMSNIYLSHTYIESPKGSPVVSRTQG